MSLPACGGREGIGALSEGLQNEERNGAVGASESERLEGGAERRSSKEIVAGDSPPIPHGKPVDSRTYEDGAQGERAERVPPSTDRRERGRGSERSERTRSV